MSRLRGDVNNDGKITVDDATALLSHIEDISGHVLTSDEDLEAADADNDDIIDNNDVIYILSHIVGLPGYETFASMPEPEPQPLGESDSELSTCIVYQNTSAQSWPEGPPMSGGPPCDDL